MLPGAAESERVPLLGAPPAIRFEADGLVHPRSARSKRETRTRYEDVTHLAVSERILWVAARRAAYVLPRARFAEPDGPERVLRGLLSRIAARPDGREQLDRMARIDALARRPPAVLATRGLAVLCVIAYALEWLGGNDVFTVGAMSPALFADGDWWRPFTGTLLHGFPLHLVLNVIGLLVLGRLAERALGSIRTLAVMGVSAVGSMAASALLMEGPVVGVSGVVFGLAGAVLTLELGRGAELPAWWRFPRPLLALLLVAFAADVMLGFALPFIAAWAHLGGFVAGGLAATGFTRGGVEREDGLLARGLAVGFVAVTGVAVGVAGAQLLGSEDFAASHAARLASLEGVSPDELNNHAWFIAIGDSPTRAQLEAALQLAERAVAETGGENPALLDTLAEVQFQLGERDAALATIERAIARDPGESYYREQRRRFRGERDPEDRPPDPAFRPRREAPPLPDGDGLTV